MPNNLRALIDDAYTNGQNCYSTFRKVPAIASTANMWVDLSMAPGTPRPNFYVGDELTFTVPTNWYLKGIWHGGAVTPYKKYLHKINLLGQGAAVSPAPIMLCDYLGYVPLIDMDNTDAQTVDNSQATLPRYTTGEGVQAFLVATQPYVGGAYFQITYTNSDGVQNRVSKLCITNTSTYIAQIVNSGITAVGGNNYISPFIPLMVGDRGIRSVQSIQFYSANGGLASLVLCRPIANMMTREATAWSEFDFIKDKPSLPRIYDGAYLNLLVLATATVAAIPVIGEITTVWST
jgi:hypothetical protein